MKDLHWNDGSVFGDPAKLKLEFTLQLVATGTRGSVNANGAGHPDRSPLPAGQPGSPDLWSPPVNGLIPATAAASAATRRGIGHHKRSLWREPSRHQNFKICNHHRSQRNQTLTVAGQGYTPFRLPKTY